MSHKVSRWHASTLVCPPKAFAPSWVSVEGSTCRYEHKIDTCKFLRGFCFETCSLSFKQVYSERFIPVGKQAPRPSLSRSAACHATFIARCAAQGPASRQHSTRVMAGGAGGDDRALHLLLHVYPVPPLALTRARSQDIVTMPQNTRRSAASSNPMLDAFYDSSDEEELQLLLNSLRSGSPLDSEAADAAADADAYAGAGSPPPPSFPWRAPAGQQGMLPLLAGQAEEVLRLTRGGAVTPPLALPAPALPADEDAQAATSEEEPRRPKRSRRVEPEPPEEWEEEGEGWSSEEEEEEEEGGEESGDSEWLPEEERPLRVRPLRGGAPRPIAPGTSKLPLVEEGKGSGMAPFLLDVGIVCIEALSQLVKRVDCDGFSAIYRDGALEALEDTLGGARHSIDPIGAEYAKQRGMYDPASHAMVGLASPRERMGMGICLERNRYVPLLVARSMLAPCSPLLTAASPLPAGMAGLSILWGKRWSCPRAAPPSSRPQWSILASTSCTSSSRMEPLMATMKPSRDLYGSELARTGFGHGMCQ